MRFWVLILSMVYCEEKIDSKQVFNSTIYMSTLAEKAMKSIRYYIEVSIENFTTCYTYAKVVSPNSK